VIFGERLVEARPIKAKKYFVQTSRAS